MKYTQPAWTTDWRSFVELLAQKYAQGVSERDAGESLAGQRISWRGSVWEMQLKAKHSPGIAVDMEHVEIETDHQSRFVGRYLFLPILDESTKKACRHLKRGDSIAFDAVIASNEGVFGSVGFAEDPERRIVFLEVGLQSVVVHL